jgi:hypothetical protein
MGMLSPRARYPPATQWKWVPPLVDVEDGARRVAAARTAQEYRHGRNLFRLGHAFHRIGGRVVSLAFDHGRVDRSRGNAIDQHVVRRALS